MFARVDSRRNRFSYVQNTRIRVLPESIPRSRELLMLYTAALHAKPRAFPTAVFSAPLVLLRGLVGVQWGADWLRSASMLVARVGHLLMRCAVVQARRCDGTGVASREDRRAQEA